VNASTMLAPSPLRIRVLGSEDGELRASLRHRCPAQSRMGAGKASIGVWYFGGMWPPQRGRVPGRPADTRQVSAGVSAGQEAQKAKTCPLVGISRSNVDVPQIQLNYAGLRGALWTKYGRLPRIVRVRCLGSGGGEIGRNSRIAGAKCQVRGLAAAGSKVRPRIRGRGTGCAGPARSLPS
jgi:hypothetical protein